MSNYKIPKMLRKSSFLLFFYALVALGKKITCFVGSDKSTLDIHAQVFTFKIGGMKLEVSSVFGGGNPPFFLTSSNY